MLNALHARVRPHGLQNLGQAGRRERLGPGGVIGDDDQRRLANLAALTQRSRPSDTTD